MMKIFNLTKNKNGEFCNKKAEFFEHMKNLEAGSYVITVEKNDIVKNNLGRYWAILKAIESETGQEAEVLHEYYKQRFNNAKSTHKIKNDAEWCIYIDRVSNHANNFLNMQIRTDTMHYSDLLNLEQETKNNSR